VRVAGTLVGILFLTAIWWSPEVKSAADEWPREAPWLTYVTDTIALAVVATLIGPTWKSRAVLFACAWPVLLACLRFAWPHAH